MKEPKENTIDFLVKFKDDIKDGKVMDIIKPYIDKSNGTKLLKEYKQIDLYVGYKELDDETINY